MEIEWRTSHPNPKPGPETRTTLKIFYALPVLFVLGLIGYLAWSRATHQGLPIRHISGKPFESVAIKDLTANLFTQGDQLRAAGNDLFMEFRDVQSNLTDVGDVNLVLEMKMPGMVMHAIGKVFRTATPGQHRHHGGTANGGRLDDHTQLFRAARKRGNQLFHERKMKGKLEEYLGIVRDQLAAIERTQRQGIETAAQWVADALQHERFIYAFGSGHSHALAEEVFYRAGGLCA